MKKRTVVATVTPFTAPERDGKSDLAWPVIFPYAQYLAQGGIKEILILGTTGEGPVLTFDERVHLISSWSLKWEGPLMVNVSDPDLSQSIELARKARLNGAHGILIAPNPGAESPAQAASELSRVANETPQLEVILYNPPGVESALSVEIVRLALEGSTYSNISGIKNSAGDWNTVSEFRDAFPELQVLNGRDSLAADEAQSSCGGLVTGLIGAVPRLALAVSGDDAERIRKIGVWVSQLRTVVAEHQLTSAAAAKVLVGMQVPEFLPACRPPTRLVTADFITAVRAIGTKISIETAVW